MQTNKPWYEQKKWLLVVITLIVVGLLGYVILFFSSKNRPYLHPESPAVVGEKDYSTIGDHVVVPETNPDTSEVNMVPLKPEVDTKKQKKEYKTGPEANWTMREWYDNIPEAYKEVEIDYADEVVTDQSNYYFAVHGSIDTYNGEMPVVYMQDMFTVFIGKSGRHVLAVSHRECSYACLNELTFLEYQDGVWHNVTEGILAGINPNQILKDFRDYKETTPDKGFTVFGAIRLPRFGTTIRLQDERTESPVPIADLYWLPEQEIFSFKKRY